MDVLDVAVGTRLRVFWIEEKRWFKGVVRAFAVEGGHKIHQIHYEDGDVKWHNLAEEFWLQMGGGSQKPTAKKAAGLNRSAASNNSGKKAALKPAAVSTSPVALAAPPAAHRPGSNGIAHFRGGGTFRADGSHRGGSSKKGSSSGATPALPKFMHAEGTTREAMAPPASVSESAELPSSSACPAVAMPPVSLCPEQVEMLPCGVVKLKGVVSAEAQQRLWDAVMCGGFDYRAVEGEVNQGANTWYTKTPGAPDILLHYNYYEPPVGSRRAGLKRALATSCLEQPPPMSILCLADTILQRAREQPNVAEHLIR